MKAVIWPGKNEPVSLSVPCSKSMAHRAILCAALADGCSYVSGLNLNKDIEATWHGVEHLGAELSYENEVMNVTGMKGFAYDGEAVNCEESGSTLRFLIPLFSLSGQEVRFTGKGRLMERPQSVYEKLFEDIGGYVRHEGNELVVKGKLQGGVYEVEGNISSQFITGLMLALPLCEKDSVIKIIPPFESRSYVLLTKQMQEKFGVVSEFIDENTLHIPGGQQYKPCDVRVEADYSQAAFFAALGALNNGITLEGLDPTSLQGDKVIMEYLAKMGASINAGNIALSGSELDLKDCPDLGPILFAVCSMAYGKSVIRHIERLRINESDRVAVMEEELQKCGVDIISDEHQVVINGPTELHIRKELDGHNDHRIVMALSILATLNDREVVINGAEAINKSYPGFFEDLRKCGIRVDLMEEAL